MNENIDNIEIPKGLKFSTGRWTRSSGRVGRVATKTPHSHMVKDAGAPHSELRKIYQRFLELQVEESSDLADAVCYGLRLFDHTQQKPAVQDDIAFSKIH